MLNANKENFVKAFFVNDYRNSLMVVSNGDEDLDYQIIPVNPDFLDFQELLEITTIDEIEKETVIQAQAAQAAHEEFHKKLIDKNMIAEAKNENAGQDLYNYILKYNETDDAHKELLFELKLIAFDEESVEDADTEIKESIRTATTPIELLNILNGIV